MEEKFAILYSTPVIYKEGESVRETTISKMEIVQTEGKWIKDMVVSKMEITTHKRIG